MRTLAEIVKTTLIGGLLIILPVYVSVILIAKAAQAILAAMKPITAVVPASVQFREVVAALVIIIVCFIAGLIVRTGPGLRAKNAFGGPFSNGFPVTRCCVAWQDVSPGGGTNRHLRRRSSKSKRPWFRR
jgi:hypothetical protein